MTEEELTRMAILKAQADKNDAGKVMERTELAAPKTEPIPSPVKEKPVKAAKETKEVKEAPVQESNLNPETGEDLSKYKFSVVLGKEKEIKFTNWTGKTKKVFKKLVENITDIDQLDLDQTMAVLLREYMLDYDTYLSDVEQQFLLIKMREASLDDKFDFISNCPNCNHEQEIQSTIKDTFHFAPGQYPIKNEELDIEFVDITDQTSLESAVERITSSPMYDGITTKADVEVAMHIKTSDNKSPEQVLDMIDELDLKTLNEILDKLSDAAPKMEMYSNRVCKGCTQKVDFETEEIPDVFEELL